MIRDSQKATGAFAVIAGLTGVAVELVAAPSTTRIVAVLLLFGVAFGLAVTTIVPELLRRRRSERSLPSNHELDRVSGRYRVEQASPEDIGWVANLEASVYSREDAVPESLLREWFAANPTGFSVVKDIAGTQVGNLDILPLRPATLEAFLNGDITEREIRGDSLFSKTDRKLIKSLYVESIVLCSPEQRQNGLALLSILAEIPAIIGRIASLRSLQAIYAIGASSSGEALMRRLGFELSKPGDRRRDRHNLFVARPSVVVRNALALAGGMVSQQRHSRRS